MSQGHESKKRQVEPDQKNDKNAKARFGKTPNTAPNGASDATKFIRISEQRLRAYRLLVEGICQNRVAKILKNGRSTINGHAKELENGGYIERIAGTKSPVIYEKGPNGNLLDVLAIRLGTKNDDTGVVDLAKNVVRVPFMAVHHIKLRTTVLRIGDIARIRTRDGTFPFLRKYQDNYHNVDRYTGKILVDSKEVTIEFVVTPKLQYLEAYLPERFLTKEELRTWRSVAEKEFRRILNFIEKYGRWKFDGVIWTGFKPHFARVASSLMKGYADQFDTSTPDSKVWSSNSHGRPEMETSEEEISQTLLSLPQRLIDVEHELTALRQEISALRSEIDVLRGPRHEKN